MYRNTIGLKRLKQQKGGWIRTKFTHVVSAQTSLKNCLNHPLAADGWCTFYRWLASQDSCWHWDCFSPQKNIFWDWRTWSLPSSRFKPLHRQSSEGITWSRSLPYFGQYVLWSVWVALNCLPLEKMQDFILKVLYDHIYVLIIHVLELALSLPRGSLKSPFPCCKLLTQLKAWMSIHFVLWIAVVTISEREVKIVYFRKWALFNEQITGYLDRIVGFS